MDELINNVSQYLSNHDTLDKAAEFLQSYREDDWKKYMNKDNEENKKTGFYYRHLVYQDFNFDIYVIEWTKNSYADIHDHPDNGCLLKVLEGKLLEKNYDKELKLIDSETIHKGDINYIQNNLRYHSIQNTFDGTSYSLHIYSPPKHKTYYFT